MKTFKQGFVAAGIAAGLLAGTGQAYAELDFQSLIREGLLGAGVGAISAGVGKGNAGTGALVGAGVNIIGGSLLSFLTAPSSGGAGQTVYAQQRQVYASQPVYYSQPQTTYAQPQPVYTQSTYSQPVYSQSAVAAEPVYTYSQPAVSYVQPSSYAPSYSQPQVQPEDSTKKIIKQGILGAGVGALSAGVGKGNAGTGALVGAGTNVIGGALLDFLTGSTAASAAPQTAYYYAPPASTRSTVKAASAWTAQTPQRRIVRTYDSAGNLVKEEEFTDL